VENVTDISELELFIISKNGFLKTKFYIRVFPSFNWGKWLFSFDMPKQTDASFGVCCLKMSNLKSEPSIPSREANKK